MLVKFKYVLRADFLNARKLTINVRKTVLFITNDIIKQANIHPTQLTLYIF